MLLLGRGAACATIEALVTQARDGHSGALVVRGEAGIGKTALLQHAEGVASGFQVRHVAGVESEMQFAFAGLHQLCAPLLDRLPTLPDPQQNALGVALGQRSGNPPNPFLVGLATLSLLAETAEERPLLCLIDDAQWLDAASAQTFAFVARRIDAEPLGLILTARDPRGSDAAAFSGLPELRLHRLGDADALALLTTIVEAPLDERVRDVILAEAGGNPLALRELGRGAQPALLTALAGGFGLPGALSVPDRVEESFRQRSDSLPADTRLLLLAAAAESTGDPALLWRAAEVLGIGTEAAAPAETEGLLEFGARVRFPHPLVRSAVYRAASAPDRRRAHQALAAATDPRTDPDRRAWHRAQAVLGTDETVAVELERLAGRARARGGLTAAAAFLERAAALTPAAADRARRALAAAQGRHQAGSPDAALKLLTVAADGPLDAAALARAELLRAQITFVLTRGSDVSAQLLDAAKMLTPVDAPLARDTYLQAIEAAVHTGPLGTGDEIRRAAEAARDAPPPGTPPGPADLLLDGLVTRYTDGYEASVPGLQQAMRAYWDNDGADERRHGLWLAARAASGLLDDEMLIGLPRRQVRIAREAGAMATLATALNFHATVRSAMGEFAPAAAAMAEVKAITAATGAPTLYHGSLALAAWRGQEAEAAQLYSAMVTDATRRGEGTAVTLAQFLMAVLHNSLGNHDAAITAATGPYEADELAHSSIAMPELIEAAVHAGRPALANTVFERFGPRARASGTRWALGLEARSRALLSTGSAAEECYREALEHLGHCRQATFLARAHLVYGEWLRREGRRRDARKQLRTAHEQFAGMGAEGFAARAARELRATGEQPRRRTARPATELTAQESHIVRLVATGATSKEIGAQLFLSPRTIDAHLRNIFRKLGITSRRQLRNMGHP